MQRGFADTDGRLDNVSRMRLAFGKRTITRAEGTVFTFCYIAYIAYLIINA